MSSQKHGQKQEVQVVGRPHRNRAGQRLVCGGPGVGELQPEGRLPWLQHRARHLPPCLPLLGWQQLDRSVLWLFTQFSTAVNSVRVGTVWVVLGLCPVVLHARVVVKCFSRCGC